jgi:hypothetical protein
MDQRFYGADEYETDEGTFRVTDPYSVDPSQKAFKISVFGFDPGALPSQISYLVCEKAWDYIKLKNGHAVPIAFLGKSERFSFDDELGLVYETIYDLEVRK